MSEFSLVDGGKIRSVLSVFNIKTSPRRFPFLPALEDSSSCSTSLSELDTVVIIFYFSEK